MDGGNLMPGSEALDKSYNSYLTSIVIFNKQNIFIKTEMDVGGAMKILLKDDTFRWDCLCISPSRSDQQQRLSERCVYNASSLKFGNIKK